MSKPNKGESKQDFLKRCTSDLVDQEGREADQAYAMCNGFWNDEHSQRASLSLAAPIELKKLGDDEADPAGFLITAYTGQIIDRGWWGKLAIEVAGIKNKAKMPILREHARDRVVGYSLKSWINGNNLLIRGNFSKKTKDAQEVQDLGDEGFPWQASIGVWPKKVKVLDSDKESMLVNGIEMKGPLEVWTESEVKEVSFVALGADDNTAAINFAERPTVKVELDRGNPVNHKEDINMVFTIEQLERDAPELLQRIREEARESGLAAGKDEGVQAERSRVMEILEADGDPEASRKAISDGTSAAETFKLLFQAEKGKKATALAEMERAAPDHMGQPPVQPAPRGTENPDATLDVKARERAREKGISLDDATIEICNENPDLLARWNPAAGQQ